MSHFTARRVTRTGSLRLGAPPSAVFPLFGPSEEQRWAEGWAPAMIYPPSGETEPGAVFAVEHPGGAPAIWTIVVFEPGTFHISYVRVQPETHLARIDIGCSDDPDGTTRADVTYTFTALTEPGNAYVDSFTETHYAEWMREWETAINHYLRYGSALPHHADG